MSEFDDDFTLDGVDLQSVPKVSLHDHLDGGLRAETVLELGEAIDLDLPESDADDLDDWFVDQSDSGSLTDYLKTFDLTVAVMQSSENLARVAREFVEDLADDGVVYGEVRWAPEQHTRGGLTMQQAIEAVQAGIDDGVADVRRSGFDIRVSQILSAMRNGDNAREVAELAVANRSRGVVGFDIAGPEDGFPASKARAAFDYLAENWMPTTIHAGEGAGLDSIRSALLDGRALRLGHGVRLMEDIRIASEDDEGIEVVLGPMAQWVKDRRITLETSPTSNLQTGAVDGDDYETHPFDLLYQLGFAVTVNVDNRLMSGTTLTRELVHLADAFSYDLDDIETFQLTAIEGAFLPVEDREALADAISDAFARL